MENLKDSAYKSLMWPTRDQTTGRIALHQEVRARSVLRMTLIGLRIPPLHVGHIHDFYFTILYSDLVREAELNTNRTAKYKAVDPI